MRSRGTEHPRRALASSRAAELVLKRWARLGGAARPDRRGRQRGEGLRYRPVGRGGPLEPAAVSGQPSRRSGCRPENIGNASLR